MNRILFSIASIGAALSAVGCGPDDGASASADLTSFKNLFVSASTVEALDGSLASVKPPVKRLFPNDPLQPEDYLQPMSCLGYYGPLGPWGPLALLGPIGDDTWNADVYVSGKGAVAWGEWADRTIPEGGALSADGPLGHAGPLSRAYWEDLPGINDFGKQLQAGGVWTALGPVGPLGPLGALGPLGPAGAHGLLANDAGDYLDGEELVRTVDVPWDDAETRTYELYENYDADHAREMDDNDTSFMVSDRLASGDADDYAFTSRSAQFVTVAVVPESASMFLPQAMGVLFAASLIGYQAPPIAPIPSLATDDFNVEIVDSHGKTIAESTSEDLVDWVQLLVKKGTALRARVTIKSSWDIWHISSISRRYRLFVTGSTSAIAKTDIRGDHQAKLH